MPEDKLDEFIAILLEDFKKADLAEEHGGKYRLRDVSSDLPGRSSSPAPPKAKPGSDAKILSADTCFVMMPFVDPIGAYCRQIYEPAIRKAGITPVRADSDIFGTGKIIDQIWIGITSAKVLVCELTGRNPNVFYELGLAHALNKPVVLVSSNEKDVPFDLQHIRVIYYDVADPFWGEKLIAKVSENILSALKNPEEALFKRAVETAST